MVVAAIERSEHWRSRMTNPHAATNSDDADEAQTPTVVPSAGARRRRTASFVRYGRSHARTYAAIQFLGDLVESCEASSNRLDRDAGFGGDCCEGRAVVALLFPVGDVGGVGAGAASGMEFDACFVAPAGDGDRVGFELLGDGDGAAERCVHVSQHLRCRPVRVPFGRLWCRREVVAFDPLLDCLSADAAFPGDRRDR